MRASLAYAAIALLPLTFAAPAQYCSVPAPPSTDGSKAGKDNAPTTCDLSNITQPPSTLTQPTPDLQLSLIALGIGTQNYTCTANATAPPTAIGAKAQLFDISCAVAANPNAGPTSITSDGKPVVGKHFFVDATTPDFDVISLGNTQLKKAEAANATNPAMDVPLLRLVAQPSSTSQVKQIYRLNTVGGVAPSNCQGKAAGDVVTVNYQAQYWFYT